MRIIWNDKEKKKIDKIAKTDKRYHLKLWRALRWWKQNYERFYNELIEAIGE